MWENIKSSVIDNWDTLLLRLIGLVLILLMAKLLIFIARRIIKRTYERRCEHLDGERLRRAQTASRITSDVSRYIIWFIALAGMLAVLGLGGAVGSFLATVGIGGVIIGIGAQSLIGDIFAGIFLLFEDQISVGDYVAIGDITGTVHEITLRTTVVQGWRGELHVIPNGKMSIVTNYSRSDHLALIDITVAYEADVSLAKRCMLEEARAYKEETPTVTGEPRFLGVDALGESGITLRMVMPTTDISYFACQRDLNARIKARFEKEGVEIPYNKAVLYLHQEGESAG